MAFPVLLTVVSLFGFRGAFLLGGVILPAGWFKSNIAAETDGTRPNFITCPSCQARERVDSERYRVCGGDL